MMRCPIIALAAVLVACSPPTAAGPASAPEAQEQSAVHPISGLPVIPLTVTGKSGAHSFRVELAASEEAQIRGLMFRTELGDGEGMIFPSQPPRPRSFWMRNTPIPLDIIFVGADRRILNIAANAVPYSLDSIPSAGPTSGVLELRGGRAAELGIVPGDRVEW